MPTHPGRHLAGSQGAVVLCHRHDRPALVVPNSQDYWRWSAVVMPMDTNSSVIWATPSKRTFSGVKRQRWSTDFV